MQIHEFLKLLPLTDLKGEVKRTGSPDWFRCFLTTPEGVSVGRVSIYRGEVMGVKWYLKFCGELTDLDFYAHALNHAMDGKTLTREAYEGVVLVAENLRRLDIEQKHAIRRGLPRKKNRRRPIEGKSVRAFLCELL